MLGPRDNLRDRLVAVGPLGAAKVEHAVLDEDRLDVGLRGGVGARRMARDQVQDVEPVLDGADAILDRFCRVSAHGALPIMCAVAAPVEGMLPRASWRCQAVDWLRVAATPAPLVERI
jgi:hypothetical protein